MELYDFKVMIRGKEKTVTAENEAEALKLAKEYEATLPPIESTPEKQPGILDAPILPELAGTAPAYAESDRQMLAAGMSPEQVAQLRAMNPAPDQTPTTLSGLAGSVARGNPLTQTVGLVGDLANSAVTALGGKPLVLNPNDPNAASKPPSQQIQEYLTSLGVKDPASETEKFTELLANFMPMGSPEMSLKARAAFRPATGELAQMVKESPVPMMTSDVFPPKGKAATTFQDLGEQNPLSGSAKARATQQDSRVKAVQDLFDRYNVDTAITVTDDVMADLLKTRGAEVKKWTDLKAGVVERADATGQMVPVDNTIATIDAEIARLKGINNRQLDPAIAELEGWKSSIKGQNLHNIEENRKIIGKVFKSPDLASVRDQGDKAVSSIYAALDKDIKAHVKAVSGDADVARLVDANKNLSTNMKDLEVSAFKSMIKRGKVEPQAIKTFLFSTEPNRVKMVYNDLSEEGKNLAKTAILSEVADRMQKSGNVSPDAFLSTTKKMAGPMGIFFTGDEGKAINGLIKALNATRRAQASVNNVATGNRLGGSLAGLGSIGLGAGAGALGGPGALAGGAAGLAGVAVHGIATKAYESKPVRDLLIRMSEVKPGSLEEEALAFKIAQYGMGATNALVEEETTSTKPPLSSLNPTGQPLPKGFK